MAPRKKNNQVKEGIYVIKVYKCGNALIVPFEILGLDKKTTKFIMESVELAELALKYPPLKNIKKS